MAFLETDGKLRQDDALATLRQALPVWMIPARIELQERLPVTASGKIDLEALRTQALSIPHLSIVDSGSGEPLAELLLKIFRSVLGLEGFGVHDDFFANGGDSLSVFEVAAAARRHGVEVPPTVVATERTIHRICS